MCLVVFSGFFLSLVHRYAPAAIAVDFLNTFHASAAFLGILGSAYFYPYAFMQLPSGLLADSWGPRKSMSCFLVIAAVGSILMGLAPNIGVAVLGRVMVGFGVSTLFVCILKLLSDWFNPREFSIMGGVMMTVAGVGSFASSAPLAWLAGVIGWRLALVAVGIVSFGIVALIYLVVRDRPAHKIEPPARQLSQGVSTGRALLDGIRLVMASKEFRPIPVWGFCGSGLVFSLAALWAGPYLVHVHGLSRTGAGAVLSMFAVGMMVGGPVQSLCANRFGRRPVVIGVSVIMLCLSTILFMFTERLPLYLVYMLFFLISASAGSTGSLQAIICKEMFPPLIAGTAMGAGNFFTILGGACWQVLMGIAVTFGEANVTSVYSVAGYRRIFLLCVISGVIALVFSLFVRETLPGTSGEKPVRA